MASDFLKGVDDFNKVLSAALIVGIFLDVLPSLLTVLN
jgi:hypothetical protein